MINQPTTRFTHHRPTTPGDLAARILAAQEKLLEKERIKIQQTRTFPVEATNAGLQYIIPGAEKRQRPNATQLELLI